MATLEDLEALERSTSGDEHKGDADMKDAESKPQEAQEDDLLDSEILHSSTRDIVNRTKLLDNDMRIMRSEFQRLTHEQNTMKEKIKDNMDKIENNRYGLSCLKESCDCCIERTISDSRIES